MLGRRISSGSLNHHGPGSPQGGLSRPSPEVRWKEQVRGSACRARALHGHACSRPRAHPAARWGSLGLRACAPAACRLRAEETPLLLASSRPDRAARSGRRQRPGCRKPGGKGGRSPSDRQRERAAWPVAVVHRPPPPPAWSCLGSRSSVRYLHGGPVPASSTYCWGLRETLPSLDLSVSYELRV